PGRGCPRGPEHAGCARVRPHRRKAGHRALPRRSGDRARGGRGATPARTGRDRRRGSASGGLERQVAPRALDRRPGALSFRTAEIDMFLVLRALRRPITVIVAMLAILLSAGLAIRRAPVDIFPDLGVPVIYVVQPYAGMSPTQMEGQLVSYYEYHFLYIAGVEHIESYSIQGMAMVKLYFHPGTDIAQSMAQVTAMTFRSTSFMPPGTLPAFIVRFDAGSIPVGQLVFSSETRGEQEIQDLALYRVRPLLATLPGVSAPPPLGGKIRTIVVYVDPDRLRAYHLAPEEVARTLARENLTLPAGNVRTGDYTTIASTNAMVEKPADLGNIPLRPGAGPTAFVRDIGRVEDGADVVYNIALV